jgi:hypothetical protein
MRAGVPKIRSTSGLSTMVAALAWPRQMVLWASVSRAARRHSSVWPSGEPQLTTMRLPPSENSKASGLAPA